MSLLVASVCGWMLTGSPLPLAFSAAVVMLAAAAKLLTAPSSWIRFAVAFLIPIALGCIEFHLFRSGEALITRAEAPPTLHWGMVLLWSSTMLVILSSERFLRRNTQPQLATGIAGGALIAASAAATVLYDYSASLIFPIASLPFAIFLKLLLFPTEGIKRSHLGIFLIILAVTTGILFGSTQGSTFLYSKFSGSSSSEDEVIPQRPPDIGGSSGAMDGASRKIPRKGNVVFDHQIRLYVKPHSPTLLEHWAKGPLYFRTATLTRFESDEVIAPLRSGQWLYDGDDGENDAIVELPVSQARRSHHYSVFLEQKASLSLPLATETNAVLASAVYEFADNWFQLSPPKEIPQFRFTARAAIKDRAGKIRPSRATGDSSPYLSLPPSPLSGKIKQLTQSFDSKDPLPAIQNYLDEKAEYSLSFSTPENLSPIENFIFGDHRGHCEHYGSATVLMLRTMGVPSRLAYGYTGGSIDTEKALFAFRDSDFHTWCEVLTPDRGWVIFDTVPSGEGAAPRYPASAKVPAIKPEDYHNISKNELSVVEDRPWLTIGLNEIIEFLSFHFLSILIGILALIGIAFGLQIAKKRQLIANCKTVRGIDAERQYPPYLQELLKLGANMGVAHRHSMTWREFEKALSKENPLIPEVSLGITYYYGVQFAGKRRDADLEAALEQSFRERKITSDAT